jgi:Flp pilus assembly protein TadG
MFSLLKRGRRDQSGATAAEFAILMPVFCVMVFGLIEVSRAMYMGASVQWAVDRAARLVVIDPDVSGSAIQEAIAGYLTSAGSPTVNITTTEVDFDGVPVVRVSATYSHTVYGPFMSGVTIPFSFETLVPRADES